jgi:hypothetical protein
MQDWVCGAFPSKAFIIRISSSPRTEGLGMLFEGPKLKESVKKWMVECAIYQDEVEDDTANFHFLAEFPEKSGNFIDIINPKNRPDMVLLVTSITIDPTHRTMLAALAPAKRQEFLEDLMKTLIFQPVGFMASPDMDSPETIQLIKDMYEDGMSKTTLMEGLSWVNRCITFIVWKYKGSFGDNKPNDAPGTMYR